MSTMLWMRDLSSFLWLGLTLWLGLAAAGCGLGVGEGTAEEGLVAGLETGDFCAETSSALPAPLALQDERVVLEARILETFFVDECHRALLLEPLTIFSGVVHEPVLAIVPSSLDHPSSSVVGEVETFELEPEPEIPEVYRALGPRLGP